MRYDNKTTTCRSVLLCYIHTIYSSACHLHFGHTWRKWISQFDLQRAIWWPCHPVSGNPDYVIWETFACGFGVQLKESGIPPTTGIQNPSSIEKDWNPVPGILNPQRGIQNPRLSWIPLHWASNDWYGMNRIPGKGPGGPPPSFLDQTKALRVCTTAPPPLSQGLNPAM